MRLLKPIAVIALLSLLAINIAYNIKHNDANYYTHVMCEKIETAIRTEYYDLGLNTPKNLHQYYSSRIGSQYRWLESPLRIDNRLLSQTWMKDIRMYWSEDPEYVYCAASCIRYEKLFRIIKVEHHIKYEFRYPRLSGIPKTESILVSSTMGTKSWSKQVPTEVKTLPIPPIGFDFPANVKQIGEYWQWLGKMTGSVDRFKDGWGHRIQLTIDNDHNPVLLIATSAGPDGKFGTKDDISLKTDTVTGKIVNRIGLKPPYMEHYKR